MSCSKYKPKNEKPVQFKLPLKVNYSYSEIQPPLSKSVIDQSLPLKIKDSSSQTQPVSSNSADDQLHFLDVKKAANRVLREASINLKNEENLTLNVA